jgi:cytoskeletal protein RodZ
VHANHGKKPTRSIRYLLSADPRFQRISLKKISVRLKRANRPPRSARSKESGRAKKPMRTPGISAKTVVLAIGVVAAATLIAAHQPTQRADVATVAASSQPNAAPERATAAAAQPVIKAQPIAKKSVGTNVPAVVDTNVTVASDAARANTPSLELLKNTAVEPPAKGSAEESAAKNNVQEPAPVMVTGCLQFDGDTFLLEDTSGVDAPKSRSWKSGFLKKHSAPIMVSDAANTLTLSNYVGQRVAATGVLISREMQVRSLQRVAASCS